MVLCLSVTPHVGRFDGSPGRNVVSYVLLRSTLTYDGLRMRWESEIQRCDRSSDAFAQWISVGIQ